MSSQSGDAQRLRLLTPREVATYLSVPTSTLYAWRRLGTGPRWLKVGHYVRYRPDDVEAWIDIAGGAL